MDNLNCFVVHFDIKSGNIPFELLSMVNQKLTELAESSQLNQEKDVFVVYEITADKVTYAITPDYGKKTFYVKQVPRKKTYR